MEPVVASLVKSILLKMGSEEPFKSFFDLCEGYLINQIRKKNIEDPNIYRFTQLNKNQQMVLDRELTNHFNLSDISKIPFLDDGSLSLYPKYFEIKVSECNIKDFIIEIHLLLYSNPITIIDDDGNKLLYYLGDQSIKITKDEVIQDEVKSFTKHENYHIQDYKQIEGLTS